MCIRDRPKERRTTFPTRVRLPGGIEGKDRLVIRNPKGGRIRNGCLLYTSVQKIFGEGTTTRLRPSYFPFTEPSVEVDVSCFACGGCGCRLCKGTGWIEVLGAGIVNKKVLENCGIDSEEYSGLAFGIGIERLAMLKYGINNIKLLYQSDMRVLDQINDD